jgi:hypothetical protein
MLLANRVLNNEVSPRLNLVQDFLEHSLRFLIALHHWLPKSHCTRFYITFLSNSFILLKDRQKLNYLYVIHPVVLLCIKNMYQSNTFYILTTTTCFDSSSSFHLGSFSLCFRKHLSLMAYCTIPVLDLTNFLHQFRATTPPKQRNLEL